MIGCECYPNHEICKNRSTCERELTRLKTLKERKQQYSQILYEIQKGKYIETININGKLHRAPKKNVLGEYIVRPEHVQVGLDLNDIIIDIQNQESIIRELRRKERNILRILKKRAGKYD